MLKKVKIESSDFESPFEIEFSKVTLITGEYDARRKLLSFLIDFIDHLSESSFTMGEGQKMAVKAEIFDWTYVLDRADWILWEHLKVTDEQIYHRRDDRLILPEGSIKKLVPNASSMISVLGCFEGYPEPAKIRDFASRVATVSLGNEHPVDVDSALSEESPLVFADGLGNSLFGGEVDELVHLLDIRDVQVIATTASVPLLQKADASIVVVGWMNGRIVQDKRGRLPILAERARLEAEREGKLMSMEEILEEVRRNRGG